jgi:flagellar hook-associated protein 2
MSSTSSTTSTGSNGATSYTPVSVASSSSAGAAGGSVINVSSLVSQLVAATQDPQQALITAQTTAVTTNLTSLGTLKSALSTFQSSLSTLSTPEAFNDQTATSSEPTAFTASADSDAVSGTYSVAVSVLATAQQILSGPVAGGESATVGTGTLTLTVGATPFTVTINASNDTLSGIAAAINSATGNSGISATVITGTDGAHLLLSSTQTGAANTITVSADETDGGTALNALNYSSSNTANYTLESGAQDAAFTVAGVPYTSPSNTVSDAIDGVSLTLLSTTPAVTGTVTGATTAQSVTVGNDTSTVITNIEAFVTAYNTLQTALSPLGSYDSTTGTAGPMMGNPVLTDLQNQIQETLDSVVGTSTYNTLPSVGITQNSDGSLSIDDSTLQTALTSNFSAVSQLFSGTTGIAAQLNTQITQQLSSDGPITDYGQTLTAQDNALTAQTTALDTQMSALSASLTQQYSALNALLSSLQSTSSYLTQAFATLPAVDGTPNA